MTLAVILSIVYFAGVIALLVGFLSNEIFLSLATVLYGLFVTLLWPLLVVIAIFASVLTLIKKSKFDA